MRSGTLYEQQTQIDVSDPLISKILSHYMSHAKNARK